MPALTQKRLLLVEDETDLCSVLSEMLSEHGWEVTPSHSLRSSRPLIERGHWSCILLDLHLSDGSADELFRDLLKLRQEPASRPLVLLMTGVPATNEESKLHAVIDGLLAKPFSISELLAKLAHVTGS